MYIHHQMMKQMKTMVFMVTEEKVKELFMYAIEHVHEDGESNYSDMVVDDDKEEGEEAIV